MPIARSSGPTARRHSNNFTPQVFPYGGQANKFAGATGITVGASTGVTSAAVILPFEIPACIFLDEYVDLISDGNILSACRIAAPSLRCMRRAPRA